jgi:hypothetical protein
MARVQTMDSLLLPTARKSDVAVPRRAMGGGVRRAAALLVVAGLAFGACGDDDAGDPTAGSGTSPVAPSDASDATDVPGDDRGEAPEAVTVEGDVEGVIGQRYLFGETEWTLFAAVLLPEGGYNGSDGWWLTIREENRSAEVQQAPDIDLLCDNAPEPGGFLLWSDYEHRSEITPEGPLAAGEVREGEAVFTEPGEPHPEGYPTDVPIECENLALTVSAAEGVVTFHLA